MEKRWDKRRKIRQKSKALSKPQITEISRALQSALNSNMTKLKADVLNIVNEDLTLQCDERQSVLGIITRSDELIAACGEKFLSLFVLNAHGNFKDRYALLQIQWSEWVASCLICGSQENIAIIPDCLSCRHVQGNEPLEESGHVSAVLHSVTTAYFQCACKSVMSLKPSSPYHPVVVPNTPFDTIDSILGFAGACMRLVYKKSNAQTQLLIKYLQMSSSAKAAYTEYGVLQPGTATHKTLPVRCLNKYLQLLNDCIKESCTENALKLYQKSFIKVYIFI